MEAPIAISAITVVPSQTSAQQLGAAVNSKLASPLERGKSRENGPTRRQRRSKRVVRRRGMGRGVLTVIMLGMRQEDQRTCRQTY